MLFIFYIFKGIPSGIGGFITILYPVAIKLFNHLPVAYIIAFIVFLMHPLNRQVKADTFKKVFCQVKFMFMGFKPDHICIPLCSSLAEFNKEIAVKNDRQGEFLKATVANDPDRT